jgi:tape measure domain-containing protein
MLNLGDLNFSLGVDTSGLSGAINRIEAFGRAVSAVQTQSNRGADNAIAQMRKQENAMLSSMETLKTKIDQISKSTLSPQVKYDQILGLNTAYNELTKTIGMAGKLADDTRFDRNMAAFRASVNDSTRMVADSAASTRALATATAQAAKEAQQVESMELKVASAIQAATNKQLAFNAAVDANGSLKATQKTGLTDRSDAARGTFATALATPGIDTNGIKRAQIAYSESTAAISRDYKSMITTLNVKADNGGLIKTLEGLGSASLLLTGHFGGLSTQLFALRAITKDVGLGFAVMGGAVAGVIAVIDGLGSKIIASTIKMQGMHQVLQAVTGSSALAGEQIDYVRKVSDQAGIDFASTGQEFAKFAAAAQNSGLSFAQIDDTFKKVAITTGTLHMSVEGTSATFLALQQMLSKGKVQAQELTLQLGNQMPGAFAIAAKAAFDLGLTTSNSTAQLMNMMQKGLIPAARFVPAFATAMAAAFNVDMSKNIETIQASQNRLNNAMLTFWVNAGEATQAGTAYIAVTNALTSSLTFLSTHLNNVLQVMAGVTGAAIGLGVALALPTIFSAIAGVVGYIGALASLTATEGFAATATMVLAEAQGLLTAALIASPLILLAIAGAAIGAKLGYDAMAAASKSASDAAAAGAATGLQSWISQQKILRTATDDATAAMQRQALQAAQTAITNAKAAMTKYQADVASYNDTKNPTGILSRTVSALGGSAINDAARQGAANRLAESGAEFNKRMDIVKQAEANMQGVRDVQNMPAPPKSDQTPLEKKKKEKSTQGAQNRITNIQDDYNQAMSEMNAAAGGPDAIKLFGDLTKAKDALRGLDARQLSAAALVAGTSVAGLEGKLTAMNTAVRLAKEQVAAFTSVWDTIDKALIDAKGVQSITTYLKGGGDPSKNYLVEAATKAEQALQKLDNPKLLEGIRLKLVEAGFAGTTAQEALTAMFASGDQGALLNKALETLNTSMKESAYTAGQLNQQLAGYGGGSDLGDAVTRYQAIADKVKAIRDQLIASGQSFDQAQGAVQNWQDQLVQNDYAERTVAKLKTIQDANKAVWTNVKTDAVSAIMGIIDGTQKIGPAIQKLAMNFISNQLKNNLNQMGDNIQDALMGNQIGGKKDKAAQGMVLGKNTGASAANVQLNTLATTAAQTNEAFQQIVTTVQQLAQANTAAGNVPTFNASSLPDGSGIAALSSAYAKSPEGMANAAGASAISATQNLGRTLDTVALNTTKLGNTFNTQFGVGLSAVLNALSSGGGGGGIFSKILGIGIGALGGSFSGLGKSVSSSISAGNASATNAILGPIYGNRAAGGPVVAGLTYQVNEQGIGKELFTPGVSGMITPPSKMGGAGMTTSIDARTTIDARGATAENIATLRQELAIRDTKLRAMVPGMVDARILDNRIRNRNAVG